MEQIGDINFISFVIASGEDTIDLYLTPNLAVFKLCSWLHNNSTF